MKTVASIVAPMTFLAVLTGVMYAQTGATKLDVNSRDKEGRTPLILAAGREDSDKIRSLIAAGADVNAQDKTGQTALMASAQVGMVEWVNILISSGAAVNAKDNNGTTALMHVARSGIKLVTKGQNGGWDDVPGYSRAGTVSALIAAGVDMKATDNTGATALMGATDIDCVKLFIAGGADVNSRDHKGETPLMRLALPVTNPAIVAILVAAGADVNARDNDGMTALMLASTIVQDKLRTITGPDGRVEAITGVDRIVGNMELVKALISHGADVNAKDNAGKSVLSLARSQKSSCVGILRKAHAK